MFTLSFSTCYFFTWSRWNQIVFYMQWIDSFLNETISTNHCHCTWTIEKKLLPLIDRFWCPRDFVQRVERSNVRLCEPWLNSQRRNTDEQIVKTWIIGKCLETHFIRCFLSTLIKEKNKSKNNQRSNRIYQCHLIFIHRIVSASSKKCVVLNESSQ